MESAVGVRFAELCPMITRGLKALACSGFALLISEPSALRARPKIRGVTFSSEATLSPLKVPPVGTTFPYEETVDPLLIEHFGRGDLRSAIFSERRHQLSSHGWKSFKTWYYAHFGITPREKSELDFEALVGLQRRYWRMSAVHEMSLLDWEQLASEIRSLQEATSPKRTRRRQRLSPLFRSSVRRLQRCMRAAIESPEAETTDFLSRRAAIGRVARLCFLVFDRGWSREKAEGSRLGSPGFSEGVLWEWLLIRGMQEFVPEALERNRRVLQEGRICAFNPACEEVPRARGTRHSLLRNSSDKVVAPEPVLWATSKKPSAAFELPSRQREVRLRVVAPKGARLSFHADLMPDLTGARGRAIGLLPDFSDPVRPQSCAWRSDFLSGSSAHPSRASTRSWTCEATRSGEHSVAFKVLVFDSDSDKPLSEDASDGEQRLRLKLQVSCEGSACRRPASRYPVLLLHGMAGRREYLGLVRYWGDIPDILGKETLGLDVHVTQTYFIAHSFKRAADLARQVRLILEQTGADRVHLIGHSQGGSMRGCSPAVLIWLTVLPASRRLGRHTWAPRFGMSIRFGREWTLGQNTCKGALIREFL